MGNTVNQPMLDRIVEEIVKEEVFKISIRLIGVTVSSIKEEKAEQLKLF